jgi:hypothetical protein
MNVNYHLALVPMCGKSSYVKRPDETGKARPTETQSKKKPGYALENVCIEIRRPSRRAARVALLSFLSYMSSRARSSQ